MAVRLSARLGCIASLIEDGESVCDVGTDHGFLPIWLAQKGGHDPVIMSDVSRGSLDKAVIDASCELEKEQMPDARLGDGLDILAPGEVDDIVIAGMGGIQILDILTWDFMKTLTYRKFIFQPRRDTALLRKWLEMNGFTITRQCVVPENGRFSEIMCVSTEGASLQNIDIYSRKKLLEVFDNDPYMLAEYEYPDCLEDPSDSGVILDYFRSELEKIGMIIDNIEQNSDTDDNRSVLELMRARERRLKELCVKKNL